VHKQPASSAATALAAAPAGRQTAAERRKTPRNAQESSSHHVHASSMSSMNAPICLFGDAEQPNDRDDDGQLQQQDDGHLQQQAPWWCDAHNSIGFMRDDARNMRVSKARSLCLTPMT